MTESRPILSTKGEFALCGRCGSYILGCGAVAMQGLFASLRLSIDQLVPCPNCGEPMRLFDARTFVCKQCGRVVDMEGILKSLDVGE